MQEIQTYIGNYGKYQIFSYIICSLPFFLNGCFTLMSTFTAGVPNTRCFIPGYDNPNTTYQTPFKNNQELYLLSDMSVVSDANVYCSYCAPNNNEIGIVNCTASMAQKCTTYIYDQTQFKTTVVSLFNMVCNDFWMNQLLESLFMVGVFIGGGLFGSLGDRFGRRKTFIIGGTCQMILTIVAPFATNYYAYCIFQILIGASQAGTYLTSFTVVMELFGGLAKTIFGIQVQSIFALGYVYIGLMAYLIRDWQYLTWSVSVLTVFYFPLFWLFPESIRWLVVNDRPEEARKIVEKAAKMNGVTIPEEVLERELRLKEKVYKASVFDLFRNGRMAVVTLIIFFTWMVCSFTYYGLSWNTSSLPGNIYVNFIISGLVEIPSYIICLPLMEYAGRRWSMVGFFFIGGVSCIVSGFLTQKYVVLGLTFLGKLCISAAFAIIYNYSAEIFPTVVRNTGIGFSSLVARIGSISAPQVALLADYFDKWLPIVIYGTFGVLASFFDLFLPETKGRQMTETLEEGIEFVKTGGLCSPKPDEEKQPIVRQSNQPIYANMSESSLKL